MKLTNIFKASRKNTANAKTQTLDKKQLEKVIGGAETTSTTLPGQKSTSAHEAAHVVQQ